MKRIILLVLLALFLAYNARAEITVEDLEKQKQQAESALKVLEVKYHQQEGIIMALDYLIRQEKEEVAKKEADKNIKEVEE